MLVRVIITVVSAVAPEKDIDTASVLTAEHILATLGWHALVVLIRAIVAVGLKIHTAYVIQA